MVFALLVLNMTVVCLSNGNTYAPHDTSNNIITKKRKPNSVTNFIIDVETKQTEIKRLYQNLLSYLSISSLSATLAKLTRRVSKHRNCEVRLLSLGDRKCTETTVYNFLIKYRSELRKR